MCAAARTGARTDGPTLIQYAGKIRLLVLNDIPAVRLLVLEQEVKTFAVRWAHVFKVLATHIAAVPVDSKCGRVFAERAVIDGRPD